MCLTTYDGTVKIATKDITVYKSCRIYATSVKAEGWQYHYTKDEENPVVILGIGQKYRRMKKLVTVDEGYHSDNSPRIDSNCIFIIPKGASYIEGWFNDSSRRKNRVSTQIIFKEVKKFNWLERTIIKLGNLL